MSYTNAQLVTLLESAIAGTLEAGAESISINGRSIKHYSITELFALRDKYKKLSDADTAGSRASVITFRNPVSE